MTPTDFLTRLKDKGVTLEASGTALRIRPASALTDEEVAAARELKPALLRLLSQSTAASDGLYEMRVRWWPDTLWFVPDDRHAAVLVREGIARYRIWTHAELASITSHPLALEDGRALMLARREFDGEVVESRPVRRGGWEGAA